jgi:acyl-CoA synthetase (AMP-forming)/AMP-acid ligase II
VTLTDLLARLDAPPAAGSPALVGADGRTLATGGEVASAVRAAAQAYIRAGLTPGTRVAFGVRQDAAGIAWLLGAVRAGIVPVVLDVGLAPAILVDRVRAAQVDALVVDGGVATLLHRPWLRAMARRAGTALPAARQLAPVTWATSPALAHVGRLDRLRRGPTVDEPDLDASHSPNRPADDPSLIVFTSGSTGSPRGVVHGRAGLAATIEAATRFLPLPPDAVVLGSALHLVVPALLASVPAVLGATRDPRRLARLVRARGITHLSLPPHAALELARHGGRPTTLLLGSAPVRNVTLRELVALLPGTAIRSIYGMTECLLVAAVDVGERLGHDDGDGDLIGPPVDDVRVRIAADGEIHVAAPWMALGYLGDDAPLDEIATGDLGRLDGEGRLVLVGRRKEMLIRGGENIYPALYEGRLAEVAGISAAVMVGLPDAHADETVVLFAVPNRGQTVDAASSALAAVVGRAGAPIDHHARPDVVLGIEELPRAGRSGKLDRRALASIAAARLGRPMLDDPSLPESTTGPTGSPG